MNPRFADWTTIVLDKPFISKIQELTQWCDQCIGKGDTITHIYFSPGDLYASNYPDDIPKLDWLVETDIGVISVSFKEKAHALLFSMRWL